MQAQEKPARNLMIRKFNELIGMRTLEEAVDHLNEKPIFDAVVFLHSAHPEDTLIKRRNRTLEMAKIIDELKNQMIEAEKQNILNALRMEDHSLENQIAITKNAIDKREQAKKLIDQVLLTFKKQDCLTPIFALVSDNLLQAATLLQQADPDSYSQQFSFFSLLKEVKAMHEILEKDQNNLITAIQTGLFEKLNQTVLKAKTDLQQQKALNALLEKYLQPSSLEIAKHKMTFWPISLKDPKKSLQLALFNSITEILKKDADLPLVEKANILLSIMIALKKSAENVKSPILAAAFEIAITEFTKHPLYKQINLEEFMANELFQSYLYFSNYFENAPLMPKLQPLFAKLKPD